MIYTVTLNPSIDYVVMVPKFQSGALNRCSEEVLFPGGKGNNVSVVLQRLGIKSTALGFVAGFTGDALEAMLQNIGIETDFVRLPEGNSRINVKLHSASDGVETEINGSGPKVEEKHIAELMKKLDKIKEGDTVVLAGSVPASLPETMYEEICAALAGRDIRIVVDAQRQWMADTLKYRPFLVKPNRQELEEFFNIKIDSQEDAAEYAGKLCEMGAQHVIVSMGPQGAVFCSGDGRVLFMDAPAGEVMSSVGSGDSMVAGFLAGIGEGKSREEAFALAVYAGSACAFLQGLPTRGDVENLMQKGRNSYEA